MYYMVGAICLYAIFEMHKQMVETTTAFEFDNGLTFCVDSGCGNPYSPAVLFTAIAANATPTIGPCPDGMEPFYLTCSSGAPATGSIGQ